MIAPVPITDLAHYTSRMQKSMVDKIFFMDKVHSKVFVDFGCADGEMIRILATLFPDHTYVGYDIDPYMIEVAKKNTEGLANVEITDRFKRVENVYFKAGDDTCLVLSSVIHEIYSYGPDKVCEFWSSIFKELQPKYIAIRDMSVSQTASRPADPLTVARIRQLTDPNILRQWENQWGSLDENWSLVHFLLKYRYKTNWEREVRENYLPLSKEDLLRQFPKEYRPRFIEHYTLPYIRQEVYKDYGVELQERTHIKLIMERT
jgi:SAM-dependent methyltransferase